MRLVLSSGASDEALAEERSRAACVAGERRERSEMPDPEYELLTVDTVADYVASRGALVERLARVESVREVGDGNLNLRLRRQRQSARRRCREPGGQAGVAVRASRSLVADVPGAQPRRGEGAAGARAAEPGRGPSAL